MQKHGGPEEPQRAEKPSYGILEVPVTNFNKSALQQTTTSKGLPTVSCTNVANEVETVSTTSENTAGQVSLKAFEKMEQLPNTFTAPDITQATEEEIVAESVHRQGYAKHKIQFITCVFYYWVVKAYF
uniref:Uncharacterized protein n=1 Tax=Glossina pallidipes TaxID=7398 RepID=A0A1A9Z6Y6_GLOPL